MKNYKRVLSLVLILIMAFSIALPAAYAAQSDRVTVRIEGMGDSVLMQAAAPVEDGSSALDALKSALSIKGYDPLDLDVLNVSGGFINTILGVSGDSVNYTSYWSYCLNNQAASLGARQQSVYGGDELVFYLVEDYQNVFAYFNKSEIEVQKNTDFSLNLKTYGYDSNYNPVVSPCSGAIITINEIESESVTDENGNVMLTLSDEGTYVISAKKPADGKNTLDGAYCRVTVTNSETSVINTLGELEVLSDGDEIFMSPEFSAYNLNYRISVDYSVNSVDIRPSADEGIVLVNSEAVFKGTSKTVDLFVGTNIITIEVENGVEYKIIAQRAEKVIDRQKQDKIDDIINACSQSYVNTSEYWKALGMAKLGLGAATDTGALVSEAVNLANDEGASASALGMWVVTLSALGYDCSALEGDDGSLNIVEKLYNMDDLTLGAFAGDYIFWLLAINSGGYSPAPAPVQTEQGVISKLCATQNDDGGWYYTWGAAEFKDIDTAAMAAAALAPYYESDPSAKDAVDKAVLWLEAQQLSTGGYGNTNTDAMVIIALSALGIDADSDARFIKNSVSVVDDMLLYKTPGNYFGYSNTSFDDFATKQGFCALVSYNEYLKNANDPYNIYISDKQPDLKTVADISILTGPAKESYKLSESFDPSGMSIKVIYNDATFETLDVTNHMISGFESETAGTKTLSVAYGGVGKTFYVTVTGSPGGGDNEETKDVALLVTGYDKIILPLKNITADSDASVFDVLKKALLAAEIDMKYRGSGASVYVYSIDGLAEFDKGENSGWKYYVNGISPNIGCGAYIPEQTDNIEFKYVTDYKTEVGPGDIDTDPLEQQKKQEDLKKAREILERFNDFESVSQWALEYVAAGVTLDIVKGDQNGNIKAKSNVTRAEFCAMLLRALNIDTGAENKIFDDVSPDSWYYSYINKAGELGIVNGTGNNMFSPDEFVSRQDMAVMVFNALSLPYGDDAAALMDKDDISPYAKDAVMAVLSNKIMLGDGQNFNPLDKTTREMAITVLVRYLETIKD